ncbi:MAG TPA: bifunctional diguanylate cyclase/phosphodiesterase, partial [Burkholderiales bacterium]|nr:bifunctional diguanylate cyclase/phosphodiesterase [Burkholderiales bacterium]
SSCLRAKDTVARLGGDEFVMLIETPSIDDIEPCLSRISEVVKRPITLEGKHVFVSPSMGVTIYPLNDADPDTLLRHADIAMYQAKQAGRNQYRFFDVEMDQLARARFEIQERMALALAQEELRLHYQPKVNLRTGEIIGVEALIRWQHPEKGLLGPIEFLPAVEQSDLIVRIGEWVADEALAQLERWEDSGFRLSVSINVAARQLQSPGFLGSLKSILEKHGRISPARLELEILETTLLDDDRVAEDVLLGCRRLGVRLSLDDFGTGYSSLAYLKRLPADTLKIDQSFVRDMLEDREDLAIIEGVVSMAKIFRRGVIAEGMESAAHGIMLLRLGCDCAQGYGISRPLSPEKLLEWIKSWKPDSDWAKWADILWDLEDFPMVSAQRDYLDWAGEMETAMQNGSAFQAISGRFLEWCEKPGKNRYGKKREFIEFESDLEKLQEIANE